jgi:ketosteroid isomerase-like protein
MIAAARPAIRRLTMSKVAHFASYAAAFEKAFENDDWSVVEPFFTEDAVYETQFSPMGGVFEGREAVLTYLKDVLDRFDRRFTIRELALIEGPKEEGDSVWIRGTATYRSEGVPDISFELEEIASFDGERISRLEDRYDDDTRRQLVAYLDEHGPALGIDG